jgi:Recombination endonuclease VII
MSRTDERQRSYIVRRAALIVAQRGLCPCGGYLSGEIHIDHDHVCCPVDRADRACGYCDRAAMHAGCNGAISRVGENAVRLRALADYLEDVTRAA